MATKSCPSCQQHVEASSTTCPSCAWRFAQRTNSASAAAIRPAPRRKVLPEVDLAFAIDRTASSGPFAAGIKANAELVMRPIAAKAKALRVWVQSHGDREYGEPEILHLDGGTADDAIRAINELAFDGGGDIPESHLDGVEALLDTVPWSLDPTKSRSALVVFATGDSKPAASGRGPAEIGESLRSRGILFVLVAEPMPALLDLADAAEGLFFPITNTPSAADMTRVATAVGASVVASVASGGTRPLAASRAP